MEKTWHMIAVAAREANCWRDIAGPLAVSAATNRPEELQAKRDLWLQVHKALLLKMFFRAGESVSITCLLKNHQTTIRNHLLPRKVP